MQWTREWTAPGRMVDPATGSTLSQRSFPKSCEDVSWEHRLDLAWLTGWLAAHCAGVVGGGGGEGAGRGAGRGCERRRWRCRRRRRRRRRMLLCTASGWLVGFGFGQKCDSVSVRCCRCGRRVACFFMDFLSYFLLFFFLINFLPWLVLIYLFFCVCNLIMCVLCVCCARASGFSCYWKPSKINSGEAPEAWSCRVPVAAWRLPVRVSQCPGHETSCGINKLGVVLGSRVCVCATQGTFVWIFFAIKYLKAKVPS